MATASVPPPVSATRPRGRRTLRVGIAIMIVAALGIAASVAAYFLFGGTSTEDAELVAIPGSFSKELTAGDWAFYSEVDGGSQQVADTDDVTIEGPGEVGVKTTYGFYSDTTKIDFEGTEYEVFMRLDVPEDGTYEFTAASIDDTPFPAVIGHYPDHDLLAGFVVYTVVASIPLGIIGFVVTIIGLIMWLTGRTKTPPPPAYYPPTA